MKNILLTRIDDRLIHGQVVTAWATVYPVNTILIIDDELTKNALMNRLYTAAAPIGIKVLLKSRQDAAAFLKEDATEGENLMILVKTPQPLEELLDIGIPLEKIILGGMGAKSGRKTFNRNISASEEEISCFKRIIAKGTAIYYQMVPNDKAVNIETLF